MVGGKNFTEQDILGEIIAQQLARRTSLHVERKLHLGGTFVCHQALVSGKIDVYPEYTGTALVAILAEPPVEDPDSALNVVAREYVRRYHAVWLPPFGFDNTFAIVVRASDARRLGLRTISDAARFTPGWRAGFGYEFMDRADGYPGLARRYALRFAVPPRVMDLGLTYRALADSVVDLIAGNSTDGQIQALHLVALADDRHYFPSYQAAPVVGEAGAHAPPGNPRGPGRAGGHDQRHGDAADELPGGRRAPERRGGGARVSGASGPVALRPPATEGVIVSRPSAGGTTHGDAWSPTRPPSSLERGSPLLVHQ